jgi:Fe2+ transport system protein B
VGQRIGLVAFGQPVVLRSAVPYSQDTHVATSSPMVAPSLGPAGVHRSQRGALVVPSARKSAAAGLIASSSSGTGFLDPEVVSAAVAGLTAYHLAVFAMVRAPCVAPCITMRHAMHHAVCK